MAEREVVALNETTPQLEVPQTGDTYLMPRAVKIDSDTLILSTSKTPASASDTGVQGHVAWDSSYIYVCIATDTWVRASISTW